MTPGRRRALLGAAGLLVGSTAGCARLAPDLQRRLADATDRPRRVLLEHPPFHPQTALQCGPAALATALGAMGREVTPEALTEQVFLPGRQGSLQVEMLAGARRQGAVSTRIAAGLEALLDEVAAGDPIVVLQNLSLSFAPRWHYAVVVGYDLDARELVLRSGTERTQVLSLVTFEKTWARGGRWAFAALPPGRFPLTADEAAAVEAAVGFERVAPPADAAKAYRAGLARWPLSLALGLGLGNTRHAQGDVPGAVAAFEQVTRLHPGSPPGWINLAWTRWQSGAAEAAREAARQALERAERPAEARWRGDAQAVARAVGLPD